jgi:hypothetical protein
MQRTLIGILSLLFSSFLFAVPASAAILPQCEAPDGTTEFVLVGQNNIIFELQVKGSGKVINGNVLVTNPTVTKLGSPDGTGFVKVGANTNIQGTVIANTIVIADGGATIKHCVADVIVANTAAAKASCGTGFPVVGTPFTDFATAHPTCVDPLNFSTLCNSPEPTVSACANSAGPLTVAAGGALTLPPAPPPFAPGDTCFGALVLRKDSVLNLGAGTWTFKSVKMESGAQLKGPAGGATVNVNGEFATDGAVFLTNIDLNVAFKTNAEVVKIFNNAVLTNTVINAPFGKCHIHTGTDLAACSEVCCKVLDVEPITAECIVIEQEVCACAQGLKFELPPFDPKPNQSPVDIRARNCVPCAPGDSPATGFPTCP